MGLRLLVILPALGLALVGCGSDAPEGGVAGVETVKQTSGPRGAWATKPELRWLRSVAAWSEELAAAGREVAAFEDDAVEFARALEGDRAALREYRAVLEPIRRCPASFARVVGPAPTERLGESARGFRQSCAHFRRGVDLLLQALADGNGALGEAARDEIAEAGKEAAVASGMLPPGEKQALRVLEGPAEESRIDVRYSAVASRLAEKEVEARCWTRRDWTRLMVEEEAFTGGRVNAAVLGFASAGGRRISLAPDVCADLDALVYARRGGRTPDVALALVTLAHESVHAAGRADEPTAECHGIQLADEAAAALGVGEAEAEALVTLYWDGYDRLPAAYRSPECRDGGELDLDEGGDGAFP